MIMKLWHWLGGYMKCSDSAATAMPRTKAAAVGAAVAATARAGLGARRRAREDPGLSPSHPRKNVMKMAVTMILTKADTSPDPALDLDLEIEIPRQPELLSSMTLQGLSPLGMFLIHLSLRTSRCRPCLKSIRH